MRRVTCLAWWFRYLVFFSLLLIKGLVTKERKNLDPAAAPFAKDPGQIVGLREGASLLEVVSAMLMLEVICISARLL